MNVVLQTILDLLFPPLCLLCEKLGKSAAFLCNEHQKQIAEISQPFCPRCGHPLILDFGMQRCASCRGKTLHFSRARSAALYRDSLRELILQWKLSGNTHAIYFFSDLVVNTLQKEQWLSEIDFLSFIPLHRRKRRQRGFDQAQELARECGRLLKIPVQRSLSRIRDTPAQGLTSAVSRQKNVENAFEAVRLEKIQGKKILLFDDVYTSGSTATEAAKALKKAGAARVYIATIARGGVGPISLVSPAHETRLL